MLVVLWMTRSITDDIPGWGDLFGDRAGDGTVSVSISYIYHERNIYIKCEKNYIVLSANRSKLCH